MATPESDQPTGPRGPSGAGKTVPSEMPDHDANLPDDAPRLKCVAVGEPGGRKSAGVGKTSLLFSLATGELPDPEGYIPEVFDDYTVAVQEPGGATLGITLFDTRRTHGHSNGWRRMRAQRYPQTDCFLVCFSHVDRGSFDHVTGTVLPELEEFAPNTPKILVGLKRDLCDGEDALEALRREEDGPLEPVSDDEAEAKAREIGAYKYMSCSALAQEGVKEVLVEVAAAVMSFERDREADETQQDVAKKETACALM